MGFVVDPRSSRLEKQEAGDVEARDSEYQRGSDKGRMVSAQRSLMLC